MRSTLKIEKSGDHSEMTPHTCWLKISVVSAGHADPKLVPRGHTGHIFLSDPGDPVHAGDEALHPGHEADACILAIEAQQEPVTLAMS